MTIVLPTGDVAPFSDVSKRLLAASSTQTLKDSNATLGGAQTTVVACSSVAGSAVLVAGQQGDAALVAVGAPVTTVPAVAGDNCPPGQGFVARFTGATLPESDETATGALMSATEFRVDVTPAGSV